MRPTLRPGLVIAWRSPTALQLGLDDPHPVVLSGLSPAGRSVLDLMDGTRTVDQIASQLPSVDPEQVRDVVSRLDSIGALIDAGLWPGGRGQPARRREQLLPDLLATAPADPDRWWTALATTQVTVVGASRLGGVIARALSESGIGSVSVDDHRLVTADDVSLGGFSTSDIGTSRSDLLRAHPGPPRSGRRRTMLRELKVLTDAVDLDEHATDLTSRGLPYLVVTCLERSGTIGPLVDPGTTACHFCVELHRRDADPAWPDLWRQRTWSPSPVALASTVAVTAHLAAAQVVSWALGEPTPAASGVLTVDGRRGTSIRQPLGPHPECGCTWRPLAS